MIGCALAGKAARQLETDAGVPSSTIDRLLIGTRKLLRLAEHAAAADAKLVLIGDPCQLPEIEAGRLGDRIGNVRLLENRRQASQWERDTLVDLRQGHTDTALDRCLNRGHITVMNDHTNACERLVAEWAEARGMQTAIMLASRRDDVDRLNTIARQTLTDTGVLPADDFVLGGRGYVEGDVVLALRNDRRLGVLNGTRAVVDTIDLLRASVRRTGAQEMAIESSPDPDTDAGIDIGP